MNTKTDGISSGLVVVAWMDYNTSSPESWTLHKVAAQPREIDIAKGFRCAPLVRLSDAEAIIAAKDAEIARLRNQLEHYVCVSSKQTERIKELSQDLAIHKASLEVRTEHLSQCVAALAERDSVIAKQSAALKLASLALSEGVEYVEEPPEKNCACHLSPPCNDCVDHSAVREFFIDARKALAAIDALGE